jgi:deoxyribonuclease-4
MQFFTHNPLQWQVKTPPPTEIDAFRRALLGSSVKSVVVHASYLINLAGEDYVRNRSEGAISREMELCYQLGADALVVHPGSSKEGDRSEAIGRLIDSLEKILSGAREKKPVILLETMAGQGGVLGDSLEELEFVLDALDWDRALGVCVDLCHVFGAGLDIRSEGGYARLVSSLEKRFGFDRVGCWHMSDSKRPLGSNADRHEHIGDGEIGVIPFGMLVSDERFADTPMILETPKGGIGDAGNLALLRKLRGFS